MSEAPHARKSRLIVPIGGGELSSSSALHHSSCVASSSSSSAGSGGPMSSLPTIVSSAANRSKAGMMSSGGPSATLGSSATLPSVYHHHSSTNHHHHHHLITTLSPMQYGQRLLDISQMDIQSALDQMRTLVSTRPQAVYKMAYYRKQTKNHWARDDPAFVALQLVFLVLASIAYSVAFRVGSIGSAISFLLASVLFHWLGIGIVLTTACREIANRHLNTVSSNNVTTSSSSLTSGGTKTTSSSLHVRQQVEWLYAFDIHCNSFFPVFVVLYGVQFFALPVALGEGLLPLFVANTLYAGALSWYWYITHLGYRALPFLSNTEVFLFPIAGIVILYTVMLIGYPLTGFGYNAARVMARFYFP